MSLSKLGRYDLVRVLGKGAMGTVYEALDPDLQRRVAVKTIAVQGLSDAGVRDYEIRFRTEARSCARLQHPHIVSVYDAGRDGDTAYLVMEYVEGNDLKHHLDQGVRFTLDQTLRIMRELLSALAYAHAQGVVHRDVKPANLLIEADGRVKLTDFGVARIQDAGDATRTRGLMVGTLKYMSPEQVQGQSIDARADLFSAGIVLYQLLTGRQPFTGDSEFAIIAQIVGADPAAPSTVHPALPAAIDAVVACALAKERDHRYATAQAFANALAVACGLALDRNATPPPVALGFGSSAVATGAFSASGRPVGAPTVTQELELVYWKDVRDSDEALDLQGFLDRFPGGIYADLARRKLGKLGVVFVGEQTATRVEPRSVAASASTGPVEEGDRPLAATPSQSVRAGPGMRHIGAMAGIAAIAVAAAAGVWWFSGA
ncbi:MAG: serine/threonine-protein kinase, partial [Burkholderiaceae bacterium]